MASEKGGYSFSQLWEVHEERIRDLERDRIEIAKEISEQTATLKVIKDDISDLATYNRDTHRTINDMLQTMQTHIVMDDQRFKSIELHPKPPDRIAEIWAQWWGKILFTSLTAGGGALFTFIMGWLSK